MKEEWKWTEEKEINLWILRSLKLMECSPAGQSKPAVHGPKKSYTESKLQIVPHSLQLRRLAMPLSSPEGSDQTLT